LGEDQSIIQKSIIKSIVAFLATFDYCHGSFVSARMKLKNDVSKVAQLSKIVRIYTIDISYSFTYNVSEYVYQETKENLSSQFEILPRLPLNFRFYNLFHSFFKF